MAYRLEDGHKIEKTERCDGEINKEELCMENTEALEPQKIIDMEAAEQLGERRFYHGMIFGAVLAAACMIVVMLVPGLIRKLTGTGNPGAKVLTQSSTLTKLSEVQQIIEDYYLDEVDGELLEAWLFKGIAAGLDDDYASYYTAEELSDVVDSTKGEYYGIGASIGTDTETGAFYVAEVYADSPAEEGGLQAEDVVRAVDGEAVGELTLTELVTLIKSKDTFVLTVYRPDAEEELDLTITCSDVIPTYVTYELLETSIGYLKLTEFTESAVEQFQDAVEDLYNQGMEKLIVDLRDNPGGLLTSVCDILDELLPEDDLIVYTEDKDGNRDEYKSDEEPSVTCEVAVLVNGGSASASEIFAGAIQDYGIGPVIGTQTYGKGVVQKTYTLSDGSAFKLTVEHYYTPNGQEIDGNGITPDIVVEDSAVEGEENPASDGGDERDVSTDDAASENETASGDENDPVLARALQEMSD
ncbi:MAG: S41 family peptidase [Lachnospiraceae bacterium]|nr:S41 family peptidase [Lachnospiraceae bacterium]